MLDLGGDDVVDVGAGQLGIAQVEVAGEHARLPGAAIDSTSACARVSSARGTSTCLNSFDAWTLPTTICSSRTA